MKHRIRILLCLILVAPFTLTACNTIEGMGEDIRAAGDKIDKEAEQNKTY